MKFAELKHEAEVRLTEILASRAAMTKEAETRVKELAVACAELDQEERQIRALLAAKPKPVAQSSFGVHLSARTASFDKLFNELMGV